MVEHSTSNRKVAGSTPVCGSALFFLRSLQLLGKNARFQWCRWKGRVVEYFDVLVGGKTGGGGFDFLKELELGSFQSAPLHTARGHRALSVLSRTLRSHARTTHRSLCLHSPLALTTRLRSWLVRSWLVHSCASFTRYYPPHPPYHRHHRRRRLRSREHYGARR